MFNEWIYGYWIYGYMTTSLIDFVVSCTLDAKLSLDDYRRVKIKCMKNDIYPDTHAWRNIRSEYYSIYYGMNTVNNAIGSLFFPWHMISYVLPHILYITLSCVPPDPPVRERDLNQSELGPNCSRPPALDLVSCDKDCICDSESKSEQKEKSDDEEEEEILYNPPGRLIF